MQDEHRLTLGVAQGGVVQSELGQGFTSMKLEILDDPGAFFRGDQVGRWCCGGGQEHREPGQNFTRPMREIHRCLSCLWVKVTQTLTPC